MDDNEKILEGGWNEWQARVRETEKKLGYADLKILPPSEIVKKFEKKEKDFSNVRIVGIDWFGRDLSGFDFSGSRLEWNIFRNCKMVGVNFSRSFLEWCDFTQADLTKSSFINSKIWNALFEGAMITDVDFSNSGLEYIAFTNANVASAKFANTTQFRVIHTWTEMTDADWESISFYLKRSKLSLSELMMLKKDTVKFKTMGEKMKLFYDVGRKLFNPEGDIYQKISPFDKFVGSSYGDQQGGAYTAESGGTYTESDKVKYKRK